MPTLAPSMVTSSQRRLAVRKRPDLQATRHRYQGRPYWIVKDPLGLNYFRLEEEEYFLLDHLDGQNSLDEIRTRFEQQFSPQKIRPEELGQYLTTLSRNRLVLSDASGQGQQLFEQRTERMNTARLQRWTQLLAIRFRGFNPDPVLAWLSPRVGWLFSPAAVTLNVLFALSALLLVGVKFNEFQARLPSFQQFFTVGNAFWMLLVMAGVKVLHEFGHGLACKRLGGECHEMGLLLLVFTPALYCNVSDSWMLPNKWHRAAIGAAGMYVELVIAALATWLWWCTAPGLLNHLCLSAMFVSSVSTLAFNGNPLMRYDGYYILADLLEVPNLSAKASSLLGRRAGEYLLGLELPDDPFLPREHRGWFMAYAVASTVYRWLVVWSMVFFLNEMFKPYRLELIGRALGAFSLVSLVGVPLWRLVHFFARPGRIDLVHPQRFRWSLAIAGGLVAALFLMPLPHRVYGTLELEPHDAARQYVEVPGRLVEVLVKPGDRVQSGQPLARLENVDVELRVAQLAGRCEQLRSQVAALRFRRFEDDSAAVRIPELESSLAAAEQQLAEKQRDVARLEIRAAQTGTVLPAPEVPEPATTEGELVAWWGSPFDVQNRGCWLTTQDMFCQVGDPRSMQALAVVEQADVVYLHPGQVTDVRLDALPGKTFRGRVVEVSSDEVRESPRHLSNKAGGELATKTDEHGAERPQTTSYHVLIYPLEGADAALVAGQRGWAKIYAPWQPLGWRAGRWFARTFQFRF
ncbi:MAG: biotin/lipoyl-binding protein [Planctomycetes bacterium]|nr:biotin/lipoyl-binding protein [Planctomycetota bacterium]